VSAAPPGPRADAGYPDAVTDQPARPPDPSSDDLAVDPGQLADGATSAASPRDVADEPPPIDVVADPCRYLVSATGPWRGAGPSKDHRCSALDPAAPIAPQKQRRLCLTAGHETCPTFRAVRDVRERTPGLATTAPVPVRPVVRTAPVVLEAASRRPAVGVSIGAERLVQAALAVMAVVVVALVGARLLGGSGEPTPTSSAGAIAGAFTSPTTVTPTPAPVRSPTPEPSADAGTPEPSAAASEAPSASPEATKAATRTYKVKRGDTLSAIAAKFGVTVSALVKLNKIKDPRTIYSGQVLKIPPAP
jgi:LysM repeat protein